ncbi:MAG: GNAT family N-acetyltransferase [Pseudomonadota bacterium]
MTDPDAGRLFEAMDATWPAAEVRKHGAFTLRRSPGGGKRVVAASLRGCVPPSPVAVQEVAAQQSNWNQIRIFQLQPGQAAFDAQLDALGYEVVDPVTLYCCALPFECACDLPRMSALCHWPPLEVQREIWASGGVGPDRIEVMARAAGPKASIFGLHGDAPAGVAFVATDQDIAMVHALEVSPKFRRQGVAQRMMVGAGNWAAAQGTSHLALAVTDANEAANALYQSLGMRPVAQYHYRVAR